MRFQSPAEAAKFSESYPDDAEQVNGETHLQLPGVAIADNFEAIDREGTAIPAFS